MHVVSLGEGNIGCDDAHGSACGDALHPHETRGVLLLPDDAKKSLWHAFKVDTLMLPQHSAVLTQNDPQHTVIQQASQSKVGRAITFLRAARSGSSVIGTLLMVGALICLAYLLVTMLSGPEDDETYGVKEQEWKREPSDVGSWDQTYREATGLRKEALELLIETGIVPHEDLHLPDVEGSHIEKYVQVAAQMLRKKTLFQWRGDPKEAQRAFQDHMSNEFMAEFLYCEGSWSAAYVESFSEHDRARREAFELLLRLDIVPRDQFAHARVDRSFIEDRVPVALELLKSKTLSEWIDICATAEGKQIKEGIMFQFANSMAPQAGSGTMSITAYPSYEAQSPVSTLSPATMARMKLESAGSISPSIVTRGATKGYIGDDMASLEETSPGVRSETAFKASTRGDSGFSSRHGGGMDSASVSVGSIAATLPLTRGSAFIGSSSPASGRLIVVPRSSGASPDISIASTSPYLTQSPGEPTTLPPTAFATATLLSAGSTTDARPLTPSSSISQFSTLRGTESARTGTTSPRQPAQIMFSNNALSGSKWEASVSASQLTPPSSQKFPKGM